MSEEMNFLKPILTLFCLLFYTQVFADYIPNSLFLKCEIKSPEYTGSLIIDATGRADLTWKSGTMDSFSCPLQVTYMRNLERSQSPSLMIQLDLLPCNRPLVDELRRDLVLHQRLIISTSGSSFDRKANYVWIRRNGLQNCWLDKFSMEDFSMHREAFQRHRWALPSSKE